MTRTHEPMCGTGRTRYRNGEEISLLCGCDGCNLRIFHGTPCHEHGCPYAWKDFQASCWECGCDFWPEEARQSVCPDCTANAEEASNEGSWVNRCSGCFALMADDDGELCEECWEFEQADRAIDADMALNPALYNN